MDSSRQALQTNGKFFFQISFRYFGRKPKNIQTNSEARILIKLQCVFFLSMDLSRQVLLNDGKFFQNSNSFLN